MTAKKMLVVTACVVGVLSGISLAIQALNHPANVEHILETNRTPISTTLTWYTFRPTLGCVYLLNPLPQRFCDPQGHPVTNHHITLNHLNPKKTYPLLLQADFVFTPHTLESSFIPEDAPGLPNPAYGQIVYPDSGEPVDAATVIAKTAAGPVSTLTNQNGRWSLDLMGSYPGNTTVPLIITANNQYLTTHVLVVGAHQPTPIIELKEAFIPKP